MTRSVFASRIGQRRLLFSGRVVRVARVVRDGSWGRGRRGRWVPPRWVPWPRGAYGWVVSSGPGPYQPDIGSRSDALT